MKKPYPHREQMIKEIAIAYTDRMSFEDMYEEITENNEEFLSDYSTDRLQEEYDSEFGGNEV